MTFGTNSSSSNNDNNKPSPFLSVIQHFGEIVDGGASPSLSVIEGLTDPAAKKVEQDSAVKLRVIVKDSKGRVRAQGGDRVDVTIAPKKTSSSSSSSTFSPPTHTIAKVVDNKDGSYVATFKADTVGM